MSDRLTSSQWRLCSVTSVDWFINLKGVEDSKFNDKEIDGRLWWDLSGFSYYDYDDDGLIKEQFLSCTEVGCCLPAWWWRHIVILITACLCAPRDSQKNDNFWGAFAKLRKATISFVMTARLCLRPSVPPSVCACVRLCLRPSLPLSFCPHGTIRLPMDGFSWNFILQYFSKICREHSSFIKIWQ